MTKFIDFIQNILDIILYYFYNPDDEMEEYR